MLQVFIGIRSYCRLDEVRRSLAEAAGVLHIGGRQWRTCRAIAKASATRHADVARAREPADRLAARHDAANADRLCRRLVRSPVAQSTPTLCPAQWRRADRFKNGRATC